MKKRAALLAALCLVSLPARAADKPATPSDPKLYTAWHAACADVNKGVLATLAHAGDTSPTPAMNEQSLIKAFNEMRAARKPTKIDLANMEKAAKTGNLTVDLPVKICYVRYTLGLMGVHR